MIHFQEQSPGDSKDFAVLRFHAGPPYEVSWQTWSLSGNSALKTMGLLFVVFTNTPRRYSCIRISFLLELHSFPPFRGTCTNSYTEKKLAFSSNSWFRSLKDRTTTLMEVMRLSPPTLAKVMVCPPPPPPTKMTYCNHLCPYRQAPKVFCFMLIFCFY